MSTYTYRRNLKREDWIKVVGVGAGAGIGVALFAGYLARIFLQRAPLDGAGRAVTTAPAPGSPPRGR